MNSAAQPLWQVILSLGLVSSLVGALLSWLQDRFRRRAELKKWRAEFYIRPKLEALRTMHAATVKAHYGINMRAGAVGGPRTQAEYQSEVKSLEMDFFNAFTLAQIYLDQSQVNAMREFLGCVRQMSNSIWTRLPEAEAARVTKEQPEFQPFHASYDTAQALLTTLLHPVELLKELEK
jgi:hypothetical protein